MDAFFMGYTSPYKKLKPRFTQAGLQLGVILFQPSDQQANQSKSLMEDQNDNIFQLISFKCKWRIRSLFTVTVNLLQRNGTG